MSVRINGTTGVTTPNLTATTKVTTADLANTGNYNGGQLGNRNLIINGAMQVAQRSTSSTGLGANSGYFVTDRYAISVADASAGRFTMSQSSDAPEGFGYSLKLDCTTADTSIASGERFMLRHKIEGQNLQQLKKGTSNAESFTISFYVKGNASATYSLSLYDSDNGRSISKTFAVTSSWNRVSLTFAGDTTGAFNNDANSSLVLDWFLNAGSVYTSGTLGTSWASNDNATRASGISSFFSSTGNNFFITGIQMEVGDTATPFEHRSYGEELAKCQRYYYQIGGAGQGGGGFDYLAHGFVDSSSRAIHLIQFPQNMRAAPTLVTSQTAGEFYWRAHIGNPTSPTATALPTSGGMSKVWGRVDCNSSGFNTVGVGCFFEQKNSVNTFIAFNAEL